jgi:hypothetical protein
MIARYLLVSSTPPPRHQPSSLPLADGYAPVERNGRQTDSWTFLQVVLNGWRYMFGLPGIRSSTRHLERGGGWGGGGGGVESASNRCN